MASVSLSRVSKDVRSSGGAAFCVGAACATTSFLGGCAADPGGTTLAGALADGAAALAATWLAGAGVDGAVEGAAGATAANGPCVATAGGGGLGGVTVGATGAAAGGPACAEPICGYSPGGAGFTPPQPAIRSAKSSEPMHAVHINSCPA